MTIVLSCAGDSSPDVALWDRFEATLDAPVSVDNPFDPGQAELTGEFVAPSGWNVHTPGFVSRRYERELVDGTERLTPAGGLEWKLRFTPTEVGEWRWRWTLRTPVATQTGDWQSFDVSGAADGRHGFLRTSTHDNRYLAFDDGAPHFAVGENLAWYDDRGTFAYDAWFQKLAAQGVNYVRLWMPSWAFGLEWTEPENTLGDYEARLDRAWQLDYVLQAAERHGIYVMLSLQNHGAFSLTANSEWDANPYNAANGGPLATPREFFTNDEARELFKRRLRYIVARWGYSPNVLAWELWNEVDHAEQPPMDELVAWHEEMAHHVRMLDINEHPITTSTGTEWATVAIGGGDIASHELPFRRLWELPEMDLTQVHLYTLDPVPLDWSAKLPQIAAAMRQRYDKPALIAEAGVDFRGPSETIAADPDAIGFHDMLWAGVVSETFGTGMTWWWDNVIDPEDLYFHFGPVATFVDGIAFDREGFRPAVASVDTATGDVRPYALTGESTALVWVKNGRHQWYEPDPSRIEGATLRLDGLPEGSWHARWLDTRSGAWLSEETVQAGGEVSLPVPPFVGDVALRLEREE